MLLGSCAITFVKKKIKTIAPINQFNFLPRWLSEKLCQLCNLVCKIWFNPGKGQRSLVLLLLSLVTCRSDRPGNCSVVLCGRHRTTDKRQYFGKIYLGDPFLARQSELEDMGVCKHRVQCQISVLSWVFVLFFCQFLKICNIISFLKAYTI